ncbi:MAG: Signal transduction response regulator, receiver domain [Nitrospira sp.]|jgi:DNA-binding response OmpR family regulator|nr:Signal transduction response regulator, receiver domain [Nitrospira sp.]
MASIFVMENDDAVRMMLRTGLTAAGYSVRDSTNGRLGINAFRKNPADLVITDIYMPERDGLEVIESLRRTHSGVKILAISGASGSMGYLKLAQSLGASAVLPKPFALSALLSIVAELLQQEETSTGPAPRRSAPV